VAAREGLKRVGRSVDRSVGAVWRALDGQRDVLVVVSDHGHVPISDVVNINQVLAEAGLLEVDRSGDAPRVARSSPMAVAARGGVAHIYLNQADREPDGVVSRASSHEMVLRAARALAALTTSGGAPVVERAFTRIEAAEIGLDHTSSGDLIAFLEPGFTFTEAFEGAAIEPSRYYGQHGYLAAHDEMCGMLFVRGAGVKHGSRKEVHVTEVAPLVARWLGIALF
jgi:predicted AlkP superfamily phosphohydrolase/phosphomutase